MDSQLPFIDLLLLVSLLQAVMEIKIPISGISVMNFTLDIDDLIIQSKWRNNV